MTWELDYGNAEQWEGIRNNLHDTPKRELVEALTANYLDECQDKQGVLLSPQSAEFLAKSAEIEYSNLPQDLLANTCYEYVEKHMTCTNGGFEAYIDRNGYYTVSI